MRLSFCTIQSATLQEYKSLNIFSKAFRIEVFGSANRKPEFEEVSGREKHQKKRKNYFSFKLSHLVYTEETKGLNFENEKCAVTPEISRMALKEAYQKDAQGAAGYEYMDGLGCANAGSALRQNCNFWRKRHQLLSAVLSRGSEDVKPNRF